MAKTKTNPIFVILIIAGVLLFTINIDSDGQREVEVEPNQCTMIAESSLAKINEPVKVHVYDGVNEYCSVQYQRGNGRWEDERPLRLDENGHYSFNIIREFAGTYNYKANCDGGCNTDYITIEVTK